MKFTSAFTLLALAALAAATPVDYLTGPPAPPAPAPAPAQAACSTAPVQCCEQVESAGNPAIATVLGLLGIPVSGVDVPVGLGCAPITVIGGGGAQCEASPVCCENNSVGGLVSIGCVPVGVSI